jgi:lipoprotein-anchoring transpeptidase ErfK/SrfK
MKRDWPDWVPPQEMIERDPKIKADLEKTPRGLGVLGGAKNPLGARALYLSMTMATSGIASTARLSPTRSARTSHRAAYG